MPDIALMQGTIVSLNHAFQIAKAMVNLHTISEVQGKVIDLQQAILDAQNSAFAAHTEQSAMIDEIRALKEEIAKIKAWEEQKKRYKLTNPWDGPTLVYALKESCKESEPAHWICTKCYDDGRRSILQPRKDSVYMNLHCPTCITDIHTGRRVIAAAKYA